MMAPSKAARVAIAAGALIAVTGSTAASAEAHTRLPHFKSNGYTCHKHTRAVKMKHRGTVWPARGTKTRTHCIKHTVRHYKPRASTGSGAWVLPSYIVKCESGGNPRAVNYSNPNRPAGLYQIITSTWLGYGGGRFAPTADRATVYQQGVVAKAVVRGQGMGAWECA